MKKITTLLTFVFISLLTYGQKPESSYLTKPIDQYTLSANSEESKSGYYYHEKTYTLPMSLETVWGFYSTVNTKEAWNSDCSEFLLSHEKRGNRYNSSDSATYDTLKLNKTYLLRLTFLKYVKIPVVFQITTIDTVNKVIQFTYMKENKSNGFQTLYFTEVNGETQVKHTSYYSSGKKFRDKYIYPKFHEVALDDFHNRIFHLLAAKIAATDMVAEMTEREDSNIHERPEIVK